MTIELLIEQGTDCIFELELRGPRPDPDTLGPLLDLTNHVFHGQMRATASSEELLAEFEFNVLNQVDTATKGRVRVTLPGEASLELPMKKSSKPEKTKSSFAFDIRSTIVGGNTEQWVDGTAIVSPAVTRDE